ncbi:MAG TPA: HEAT repeat domain-containing protein [Tepidisphaeraceae bacterium]|nr:HEAT repeat domain-containing protein [Tepidisphaeraceae bacterium]
MPSDVKRSTSATAPVEPLIEPPSVKLIVRLFVIPFFIVAVAVGIMFLIGRMAGGEPTLDEALARLKSPGGERTADVLVGPASKQRYIDAKTVVDKMKLGMSEAERVTLTRDLIDIIDNYTRSDEGDVRHFMLLALGRAWQRMPSDPPMDSPAAIEARQRAMATILKYADDPQIMTRKAAILSLGFWSNREEAKQAIPKLIEKVRDEREDLDVRMAAATSLGPIASPNDAAVLDALRFATRDTDPKDIELVWDASLSLAQLNQPDSAETIEGLLDRDQLAKVQVYDRDTDPKNPVFRSLSDAEVQRILINTMIGASKLQVPAVQERIRKLAESDPSARVREAAQEVLHSH